MKLRISLLLLYLFGIGLFAHAQHIKKSEVKVGHEQPPVVVFSSKKAAKARVIKPAPITVKGVKPPPPKFAPPKIVKDAKRASVPARPEYKKPIDPASPPVAVEIKA